eukprot:GSChrysophyteH1.ASY1.ANO1.2230.1 assembled CDS
MAEKLGLVEKTPKDVLDFWFRDWLNEDVMGDDKYVTGQLPLWFGIGADYKTISPEEASKIDQSCHSFAELIRAVGREDASIATSEEWQSADGLYAQIILTDQISRNCFRGTPEAFATDGHANRCVQKFVEMNFHKNFTLFEPFLFLVTPAQHSEKLSDHAINETILQYAKSKWEGSSKQMQLDMLTKHCREHRAVVEKFGRYPHRNAIFNRVNSTEEEAWLADVENLPTWAKSQVKRNAP